MQTQTNTQQISIATYAPGPASIEEEGIVGNATTGSGWLPPTFDPRDYTSKHSEIAAITSKIKLVDISRKKIIFLPAKMDLLKWFSAVRRQDTLNSCTAFAIIGIVEYFENKAFSKSIEASALFVYKCTRNLMQKTDDTGSEIRTAMKALALFGVPGEQYWPYTETATGYNVEPTSFLYAMASNYRAVKYFCHDPLSKKNTGTEVLCSVKIFLAAGIPAAFGVYMPPPTTETNVKGGIPFYKQEVRWAKHALVVVGYDDEKMIHSNSEAVEPTKGAFLIRNCRGTGWGDKGYGWLPYEYVISKRAIDFWSLISADWIDTAEFGVDNIT